MTTVLLNPAAARLAPLQPRARPAARVAPTATVCGPTPVPAVPASPGVATPLPRRALLASTASALGLLALSSPGPAQAIQVRGGFAQCGELSKRGRGARGALPSG